MGSLKMFHVEGVFGIFFQGLERNHIFIFFFRQSYFEKNRGTKTALVGYGGMLLRKSFENLRNEMAILVLSEQFLRKILLKSLPLIYQL